MTDKIESITTQDYNNNIIHIANDKEIQLLTLSTFFTSPNEQINSHMAQILPILRGETIALRTIEWFVTNYCKEYNISYTVNGNEFNVFNDYRCQLMGSKKRYFDPCCRDESTKNKSNTKYKHQNKYIKFRYTTNKNDVIHTSIGQLNFFKWFVENNLLEYIQAHLTEICDDQRARSNTPSTSLTASSLSITSERKRHQLSENSLKKIYVDTTGGVLQL